MLSTAVHLHLSVVLQLSNSRLPHLYKLKPEINHLVINRDHGPRPTLQLYPPRPQIRFLDVVAVLSQVHQDILVFNRGVTWLQEQTCFPQVRTTSLQIDS